MNNLAPSNIKSQSNPIVTVLIPAYNAGRYILQTVQSVQAQTFPDWCCLIFDDASTDDTQQIAKELERDDPRIKYRRNARNLGMLGNWNAALESVTTPYLVKLDADDLWEPTLLERSIEILTSYPEVALTFCQYREIDSDGNLLKGCADELPDFAKDRSFQTRFLVQLGPEKMFAFPILRQGLSVMRSAVVRTVGNYRHLKSPATQAATDTEFYFRVGLHYHIHCQSIVLYSYRRHPESITFRDSRSGLEALKLWELRQCIFEYAQARGILTGHEFKIFMQRSEYLYLQQTLVPSLSCSPLNAARILGRMLRLNFLETFLWLTALLKKRLLPLSQ